MHEHDTFAVGIRTCNPSGPLALASQMTVRHLPPDCNSDPGGGRFYALARVFSPTARSGPEIHIHDNHYVPGGKDDLFGKYIQRIFLMAGPHTKPVRAPRLEAPSVSSALTSACSRWAPGMQRIRRSLCTVSGVEPDFPFVAKVPTSSPAHRCTLRQFSYIYLAALLSGPDQDQHFQS
ncbi:hypothetical protein FIBSPDRAFT_1020042 [Athelia psychrophila]|uniref:Uncharacterized protein n=1 Tax=Athelia psychrophila TaxID=1759441 RepID=A0A166K1C1_9AGAM|nr:hypothetical protein FIBSPDRAFT_1020042 [Fibularhizoctonia sp. CBS 109695]